MEKLNLEKAITEGLEAVRALTLFSDKPAFGKVIRGIEPVVGQPAGAFPLCLAGLVEAEFGEQTDSGEILLVCVFRGRNHELESAAAKELFDLVSADFESDDITVTDIRLGDLCPGYTEGAESPELPPGSFIAAWLEILEPAGGFFFRLKISVDSQGGV